MQKLANGIQKRKFPNDKFYTPLELAKLMIEITDLKPGDLVLEPCRGNGAIYNQLPFYINKEWAEIDEGKDFFDYHKKVDCIISNPPFSLWSQWLDHTMKITDKFCYLMNTMNLTEVRLKKIFDNGFKIKKLILTNVDWWFGNVFIILFDKNHNRGAEIKTYPRIYCECGKRCKRGRGGNNPNICPLQTAKTTNKDKPIIKVMPKIT